MHQTHSLNTKSANYLMAITLIFYSAWFYYLCFINLPKGDFYIPNDEFMIPDSGIFAWYGLPSRCLEWPANPMLFFYYVLIGFLAVKSFIWQHFFQHSTISFFEVFDQQVYDYILHKPDYLVYGRVFQYFTVIFLCLISYKKLQNSIIFRNNLGGLVLFFSLLLGSQTLLSTTAMVRPDAIAILLAVYFWAICFSDHIFNYKSQVLLVFIFACILSFRTVFLFLFPIVLYLIFSFKNPNSISKKLSILGLFVVFYLCLNPFLVHNTFLFAKAFLGNIIGKRHNEMAHLYNIDFIIDQFSQNKLFPIFIIFSIWGIYKIWQNKLISNALLLIILFSNLIYLHSALSSPTLFTTHLAPVLPLFLIFVAIGLQNISNYKGWGFAIIFLLIMFNNFWVNKLAGRGGNAMNYFTASQWFKTNLAYKTIAVPEQLDVLFATLRSKESFKFEYSLLNNEARRSEKINKLFSLNDSTKSSNDNGLLQSFMFDEEQIKAAAAFISVQQTPDNKVNSKMVYLFDDNTKTSGIVPLHCQPFSEINNLIGQNKIDYILTKNERSISNFELKKRFDQGSGEIYFIYGHK